MYVCTREREREDAVIADFGSRRGFPLAIGRDKIGAIGSWLFSATELSDRFVGTPLKE